MIYKIKDLCDINTATLKNNHNLSYIDYLDTANLNQGSIDALQRLQIGFDSIPSRAKRVVRDNDILFSTVRPNQLHYGFISKSKKNLICSTGFAVLTPKDNIIPYYLYKYLTQKHIIEYLQGIAETSTSTYPSIKPSDIGELDIDTPSLEEQKAIANILSSLDDKIEINNKINQNLEMLAQTLYKHWFVDFEFPNENGEPYKSSGGEMVDSELGLIPKGWSIERLNTIADIERGLSYKGKHLTDFGVPMINLGSIQAKGGYNYKKIKYYDGDYKEKNVVSEGDIIIANTDMTANRDILGTPIIVPSIYDGDIIFSHHLFALKRLKISRSYLYYYLKSEMFKSIAENYANGTTVLAIAKNDVEKAPVLVPNAIILKKFCSIVDELINIVSKNEIQNIILTKTRDTLLPKLMNGEIEVPV